MFICTVGISILGLMIRRTYIDLPNTTQKVVKVLSSFVSKFIGRNGWSRYLYIHSLTMVCGYYIDLVNGVHKPTSTYCLYIYI